MFVHILGQSLRLSPVVMQTYVLLLLHFVCAVEYPRVQMRRCVPQLVHHLYSAHVLCRWVDACALDLIFLALPLCANMLGFAQVFLFVYEALVFLVVLI